MQGLPGSISGALLTHLSLDGYSVFTLTVDSQHAPALCFREQFHQSACSSLTDIALRDGTGSYQNGLHFLVVLGVAGAIITIIGVRDICQAGTR
jgi:hypothetical protein